MDLEKKQKEDQQVANFALTFIVLSFVLFIAAIVHSAVFLAKASDKTKAVRIGFLLIAIVLGPVYWLIYPIVYLAGGFKN